MVAIQAHDIVQLDATLVNTQDFPEWFTPSGNFFATVRRDSLLETEQEIPLGLRGINRNQRFAFVAPRSSVKKVIHPYDLTDLQDVVLGKKANYPVYLQYLVAQKKLNTLRWGVGGSLGFELATGIPSVKATSDLDLLLYLNNAEEMPMALFDTDPAFFEIADTQIITAKGGFALKEYLQSPNKKILLKTNNGPLLTQSIW